MKNMNAFTVIWFLIAIFFISQCTYEVSIGPTVSEDVSFSKDIIPLFNKHCNNSGCHNSGGIKPDLTPSVAFKELTEKGYINVATPSQSEVYLWMKGDKALPMPLDGPNANLNALVLAWITQGAKNN